MAQIRKQHKGVFPSAAPSPVVNIAERRSKRESLQDGRKPIIFLACPTVSGRINFTIAMAFARAMASNSIAECPFQFMVHVEVGKRPIDHARNCIVRTFLHESDADWLYMIDDDQIVPDNFWQLCLVRDADVVNAPTPVWVANMLPEAMLRVNNYGVDAENRCYNLPSPPRDMAQPYRVPIVGTGAIAIRRRVFAPKPHGVGDTPFYFTFMEDRKVRGGEDVNFSVECNRAGFVLATHPGVWYDHMKELALGQISQYYDARHKMEQESRTLTDVERLSIG